jgi:hypothetical protein
MLDQNRRCWQLLTLRDQEVMFVVTDAAPTFDFLESASDFPVLTCILHGLKNLAWRLVKNSELNFRDEVGNVLTTSMSAFKASSNEKILQLLKPLTSPSNDSDVGVINLTEFFESSGINKILSELGPKAMDDKVQPVLVLLTAMQELFRKLKRNPTIVGKEVNETKFFESAVEVFEKFSSSLPVIDKLVNTLKFWQSFVETGAGIDFENKIPRTCTHTE